MRKSAPKFRSLVPLLPRFMAEKALKGLHASIDLVIKDFRCTGLMSETAMGWN